MVVYYCHHLSDNYVDLSDLEVVLSVIYVIRESCLRNIYKTEIPAMGPIAYLLNSINKYVSANRL